MSVARALARRCLTPQPEASSRGLQLLAIVIFLTLSGIQASKPLNLDSMDFPAVAAATASSGVPIYYRGEEKPFASGLYHPPLYIYSLALWFKFVGTSPASARLFGALCLLFLGKATLLVYSRILGKELTSATAGWFWLVFLLNPFSLQAAAIPDIDSSIYGPVLLATLWLSIGMMLHDGRLRASPIRPREYGLLALLFAVAFWCKLTTVFVFPIFSALILSVRFGLWRSLCAMLGVVLLGFALFLGSYWAYGWLAHVDILYTFSFLWYSFVSRGSSGNVSLSGILMAKLDNLRFMTPFAEKWTTILPWVTGAALFCIAVVRGVARRDSREFLARSFAVALVVLLALTVVLYYCAQVISFGNSPVKYWLPVWGLLIFPIAWLLAGRSLAGLTGGESPLDAKVPAGIGIGIFLISALAGLYAVRDTHILNGRFNRAGWVLLVTGILAFGFIIVSNTANRNRKSLSIVTCCMLLLHTGLQAGICFRQAKAPYSTTYNYGQRGLQEAAGYISAVTATDEVISSMKDIGFTANRRYIENYAYLDADAAGIQRYSRLIEERGVRFLIFTSEIGEDQLFVGTPLEKWVAANARQVREIGNYRIFEVIRGHR